jgi:predicted alpha/beta-fold hydrolase
LSAEDLPPFHPHPLLRGGHRQTLFAYFIRSRAARYSATRHRVDLPDGDVLMLHDDCPPDWGPGRPFAVLMHGLGGCHSSPYIERIAGKLTACGVRTFRLDHRGAGAGANMSRLPYHAGRSEDVREAFEAASRLCPGSLGGLAGFSLSGNMLLKMLGENGRMRYSPEHLACAMAVNPPIDLSLCSQALGRTDNRFYDRYFTKLLVPQVQQRIDSFPDAPRPAAGWAPQTLREFDETYTAPASGFASLQDYYDRSSSAQFVESIETPTFILTGRDDPLIPACSFEELPEVSAVSLHIADHGGHLGYVSGKSPDPDRRWMDWRVIDWLAKHLRFSPRQM